LIAGIRGEKKKKRWRMGKDMYIHESDNIKEDYGRDTD